MKSYLSIALLSKNPLEEKSLCKKLDEIDKMKNKILRESAAKMSNFALQHLYITKYYDAKNGEQCRPPHKIAQSSVCSLPRLSEKRQQSKSASFPGCFETRTDCATSKPRFRRSLSEKCLPVSANLSDEKDHVPGESKPQSIASRPNSARQITSAQNSKPKYRRSMSEVVAPGAGFMLAGEDEELGNAPRKFHAWGGDVILEPKLSKSNSQYLASQLDDLMQEGSRTKALTSPEEHEAAFDEGKEAQIPFEALKRRKQRRTTVAGERPSITREFSRWQQTVKLVKDLPKSEQAEIIRGACFFRRAVPGFSTSVKTADTPKPARQRKISTVMPPCGQELARTTHKCPKFTALTK